MLVLQKLEIQTVIRVLVRLYPQSFNNSLK